MKKITILISTIIAMQFAQAQPLTLILTPNPNYVATVSEWGTKGPVLNLMVMQSPQGPFVKNVKINTVIKTTDGTTVATTDMLRATIKPVSSGTTIFSAADVFNMQALVFAGSYQNKINSTGKLPTGNYQVIVRLDSTSLPIALSAERTRVFYLAATQLPVLIAPANEAILPAAAAQTAITFRWTAFVPKPLEALRYRVQVFEVLQEQTPMQALRSNQPLLDKEVLGTTQFIWQPQLSFADGSDKKFVWTVQTFDFKRQLLTGDVPNGEGRSEAKIFTVSSTAADRLGKRNNGL